MGVAVADDYTAFYSPYRIDASPAHNRGGHFFHFFVLKTSGVGTGLEHSSLSCRGLHLWH